MTDESPGRTDSISWKRGLVGILVAMMGPVYLVEASWPSMWSVEHITAGLIAGAFLIGGVAISRGWGFRV